MSLCSEFLQQALCLRGRRNSKGPIAPAAAIDAAAFSCPLLARSQEVGGETGTGGDVLSAPESCDVYSSAACTPFQIAKRKSPSVDLELPHGMHVYSSR